MCFCRRRADEGAAMRSIEIFRLVGGVEEKKGGGMKELVWEKSR